MSIQKNIASPYTIYSVNRTDPIILDSSVIILNGNVQIKGNTTTVSTQNSVVADNIIQINSGETGAGVSGGTGFAGIEVGRGSLANVQLRWNETLDVWQVTNDGTTYTTLVATTTGYTKLIEDTAPQLSANLVTGANWLTSNTTIQVDPALHFVVYGNIKLQNQTNFPAAEAGNTYISAGTVSTGGSGLYVINPTVGQDELVTKGKAIVFSLIF